MLSFYKSLSGAFIAVVLSLNVAQSADYDLDDLKALASENNWKELLEHAKKISPKDRADEWRELVEQSSIAQLQQISNLDAIASYDFIVTSDSEHPFLINSAQWSKEREVKGIEAITACFENNYYRDGCLEGLNVLVMGDIENDQLAFEASLLTRLRANSIQAVPYLHSSLKGAEPLSLSERCENPDTALIALPGLEYSDNKTVALAKEIIIDYCPDTLSPLAFDLFLDGSRTVAKSTCSIWNDQQMLSEFQQAHCLDMEDSQ